MSIHKCPDCLGHGRVYVMRGGDASKNGYVDCPGCGGHGVVAIVQVGGGVTEDGKVLISVMDDDKLAEVIVVDPEADGEAA